MEEKEIRAMPKEVQDGLSEMRVLDVQEKTLLDKCDRIQQTSPFCQLSTPFFESLDEAVKIGEAKARIWNNIRGFIIPDKKKTLWQLAVAVLPVRRFGEESILPFGVDDILKLIR
jgi:hypothetical protein